MQYCVIMNKTREPIPTPGTSVKNTLVFLDMSAFLCLSAGIRLVLTRTFS